MLSQNMHKALEALLVSNTREEAAQKAGINRKTLRNYFQNEEFTKAYRAAFGDLMDAATRQAQQILSPALSTLAEICRNKKAGYSARIAAARAILEYGLKLTEQNDLGERVAQLERQAAE